MGKFSRSFSFDRTATIIGIIISFFMFIAQGPYNKPWKIYLPFSPLLIVFLYLAIKKIIKEVNNNKYKYLLEEYKIITMTRIVANWQGRIENENGDLSYRKEYHMELVQPGTVHKTKGEFTFVKDELPDLPPKIVSFRSSNSFRNILPTDVIKSSETVKGEKCFKYEWRYNIIPPLTQRSDFIEYAYEYFMPGVLKKAFSTEGDIFIFEQRKIQQETHVSIISPKGYFFQIIESFIEDYDGQKKEIPKLDQQPVLLEGGSTFSWTIEYIHLARYICLFRLVNK